MVNLLNLLYFLILLSISLPSFGLDPTHKVVQLKGEIFYLNGDGSAPKKLVLHQELQFGQIIKTSSGSFTKIKIRQGGALTIGPNTVIKILEPPTISLTALEILKGQVRATYMENSNRQKKIKLYIHTKTAAIGVRGTDFHLFFNQENHISSLLSYQGNVYFKKLLPFEENFSNIDLIDGTLGIVKVPQSSFSTSVPNYKNVSKPIKISPLQFKTLKKNQHLSFQQKEKNVLPQIDTTQHKTKQNGYKESEYDSITNEFEAEDPQLRPGGYLDLETAIYVQPPKEAEYDDKNKVYIPPKEYGSVDKKSGKYIPPKGLSLHPLQGFKIISKEAKKLRKKTFLALKKMADKLNKTLDHQFFNKIHNFIKSHKYLSKFKFLFDLTTLYDSNITYRYLGETFNVTNLDSMKINSSLSLEYKNFFSKRWFINPKGYFENNVHLKTNTPLVRTQDNNTWIGLAGLGRRGRFFGLPSEVEINLINKIHFRKSVPKKNYIRHYDQTGFSLSFRSRIKRYLKSKVKFEHYFYDKMGNKNGNINTIKYSQIYSSGKNDHFDLNGSLTRRTRIDLKDSVKNLKLNLIFLRNNFFDSATFFSKIGFEKFYSGNEKDLRGYEDFWDFTVGIRTDFENFNFESKYNFQDLQSKESSGFEFSKHIVTLGIKINY